MTVMGRGSGGLLIGALAALAVAAPAQAAFPGENGKIAFVTERDGNQEIYSMNPDGTDQTNLTNTSEGSESEPAWSADGERIVYQLYAPDTASEEIWSMAADGTDQTRLTNNDDTDEYPSYSPDGSRIVFSSRRDGDYDIYSMNADGSDETPLTNNSEEEYAPVYSPDGSKIVFYTVSGLASMDSDGSGEAPLAGSVLGDHYPAFSPDGARIVFASGRDHGPQAEIYSMSSGGGGVTRLTNDPSGPNTPPLDSDPDFSPDGEMIIFTSEREELDFNNLDVLTMNPNGSGIERLTTNGGASNGGINQFDGKASWQPIVQCEAPSAGERRRVGDMSAAPVPETGHQRALGRRGDGGGAPEIAKLMPAEAVAGAAVLVRGDNLGQRKLRATVGGRKAKTSSPKDKSLYVEVPDLKPGKAKLVLRAAKASDSASLRIEKPFDGEIESELDQANRVTAPIGPAGGELSAEGADGTRYRLQIPAGALLADTEISLTPVKRFKGLPFSGKDVAGAALGPDGLILAAPATLTITGGGDFDPTTVGFGQSQAGFESSEPSGVGETLVLQVEHFSSHGAAEAAEADIANAFRPIIDSRGNLSRAQIREMLRLLAIFDRRFSLPQDVNKNPPSWCKRQPICVQAVDKAVRSMDAEIAATCQRGMGQPSLFVLKELADLQAELQLLTGTSIAATECMDEIGAAMGKQVIEAITADPLGRFRAFELLTNVSGDLDGDGSLSAWEMGRALIGEFDFLGLNAEARALDAATAGSLGTILERNLPRCETEERPQAADALRRGHAYAASIGSLEREFLEALDKCGVAVVVTPAFAEVETGETRQFFFQLTNVDEQAAQRGVTWTSGGGTIDANGLFTAGSQEGTFAVRATSVLNPNRSASATVEVVDAGC